MNKLSTFTEEQAKHLCKLLKLSFISLMTNTDGKWDELELEVQICVECTMHGDKDDSFVWIFKDGKVCLHKNNGQFGGSRYEPINGLIVTDYLRQQGFTFNN